MSLPTNLPQRANIQGLWHLDEASGNALDVSPNGNDLTETSGTIASATGVIGNCRDFELDETEYFEIADAAQTGLDIETNMSIAFWLKGESFSNSFILGKWGSAPNLAYNFFHTGAALRFSISADGTNETQAICDTVINTGTWYHICGVYDGTDVRIYRNGILDNTPASHNTGIFDATSSPFGLGGPSVNNYDGLLDEVIVWNTALTAAEALKVKNISAYSYGSGFMIFLSEAYDKGKKYFRNKGLFLPEDKLFKPAII